MILDQIREYQPGRSIIVFRKKGFIQIRLFIDINTIELAMVDTRKQESIVSVSIKRSPIFMELTSIRRVSNGYAHGLYYRKKYLYRAHYGPRSLSAYENAIVNDGKTRRTIEMKI